MLRFWYQVMHTAPCARGEIEDKGVGEEGRGLGRGGAGQAGEGSGGTVREACGEGVRRWRMGIGTRILKFTRT